MEAITWTFSLHLVSPRTSFIESERKRIYNSTLLDLVSASGKRVRYTDRD